MARGGRARKERPEIGRRRFRRAGARLRESEKVALALNRHVGFFRRAAAARQTFGIHSKCIVRKMSMALCLLPCALSLVPSASCRLPFAVCRLPLGFCRLPFVFCHQALVRTLNSSMWPACPQEGWSLSHPQLGGHRAAPPSAPGGAMGCSHGWSGATVWSDAEPVGSGRGRIHWCSSSLSRPGGAKETPERPNRRPCPAIPPPPRGG